MPDFQFYAMEMKNRQTWIENFQIVLWWISGFWPNLQGLISKIIQLFNAKSMDYTQYAVWIRICGVFNNVLDTL